MNRENKIILGTRFWNLENCGEELLLKPPFRKRTWTKTPFKSFLKPRFFNEAGLYAHAFKEDSLFNVFTDSLGFPDHNETYGVVAGSGKTFIHGTKHETHGFRSHQQQILALLLSKNQEDQLQLEGKENVFITDNRQELISFVSDFITKNKEIIYNSGGSSEFYNRPIEWERVQSEVAENWSSFLWTDTTRSQNTF